jgi:hypothetical protein
MALFRKSRRAVAAAPPMDPALGPAPWPVAVIVGFALAGLISPLITFSGAIGAYALADQEQGTILTGAGLVHMIVALTFAAGA